MPRNDDAMPPLNPLDEIHGMQVDGGIKAPRYTILCDGCGWCVSRSDSLIEVLGASGWGFPVDEWFHPLHYKHPIDAVKALLQQLEREHSERTK